MRKVHNNDVVRAGILGAGYISQAHLVALRQVPGVQVSSVCDVDAGKAEKLAIQWKIPHFSPHMDEMFERVDVIHILVPPKNHADAVLKVLTNKCDAFLEKPMGITVQECKAMTRAAEDTGRRLAVNHNFVYHPAFQEITRAVTGRRLGAVQHITAVLNVPLRQLVLGQHDHWMFRAPGNIILEQAPHSLSQIEYLLGPAITVSVTASDGRTLNNGSIFYTTWQISMQCERGTAQCFLSFGKECFDHWIHVIGQDATACADLRRNAVVFAEKSRFMDPFDNLRHAFAIGGGSLKQGLRNFAVYMGGFLKLRPPADAFSLSFQESLKQFYQSRQGLVRFAGEAERAQSVIKTCERIILAAHLERSATYAQEAHVIQR